MKKKYVKVLKQTAAKIAGAVRRARRSRADAAEWKRRCEILSNVLAETLTLKQRNL